MKRVKCPHCQQPLSVADASAGHFVSCAACGGTFEVPKRTGEVALAVFLVLFGIAAIGGLLWWIHDGEAANAEYRRGAEELDRISAEIDAMRAGDSR